MGALLSINDYQNIKKKYENKNKLDISVMSIVDNELH